MWRRGLLSARQQGSRILPRILPEIPEGLRDATEIVVTGRPSARHYSSIAGYRPTLILGRRRLTGTIRTGVRTLITAAHEDDKVITRVKPTEPAAQAMVVNHTALNKRKELEATGFLIIPEQQKPKILSTTNPHLDRHLREQRKLTRVERSEREEVIAATDRIVGGVTIDSFGPYFGGNPTHVFLPRTLEEAIYPDATKFTTQTIDDYRLVREETEKHGPRISGHKDLLLVVDAAGQYRTAPLESRAFVNSTVHRGMQKGPDGLYHPTTCYTPGSALVNHAKSSVAERHDGSTLQTISIATNASADVLCHWLLRSANQVLGVDRENLPGLKKMYSKQGVIESLIVHQGLGQRLTHLGLLATGTPFDMTTLTIHRDKEGNPLNVMVHKRTKPWPANESLIEIKGPDGKRQCVIYDSIIPKAGFWRSLTVGKLTTPIMSESIIQGSIKEGQLGEITDPELLADMQAQNEKGRYTFGELLGEDVPISMLMSAAGLNRTDPRARVTLVSETGEFDNEKIIRDFIEQDPQSMEYYFCGRAARVLAENLAEAIQDNYTLWVENASVRNLWSIVTSATPTYENLEKYGAEYATVIKEVMKDPAEIERMNECIKWAKEAHDATIVYDHRLAQ